MISNERTQNIIIATTIIVTIVSSTFLVTNAMYYTGTYTLLGNVEVSFEELIISNIDPLNDSVDPRLQFRFNVATSSQFRGNVLITFMGFTPTLNGDELTYTPLSYTDDYYLTVDFDRDFLFNATISVDVDRNATLDAYELDTWFWQVDFRYSYILFDLFEPQFVLNDFNITEVTII